MTTNKNASRTATGRKWATGTTLRDRLGGGIVTAQLVTVNKKGAGAALEAPGIDRVSTVGVLEIEIALPQEAQKRAPSETITPHTVQVIIRRIVSYRQGSSYELVRVNGRPTAAMDFIMFLIEVLRPSQGQLGSDFDSPGEFAKPVRYPCGLN